MIVRVWGIVNSTEIEFTRVENKPDYWEGYAPRQEGLQDIEIWAEDHRGARGHLQCSVSISWYAQTQVRLVLCPYVVELVTFYNVELASDSSSCGSGCKCCRR